MKWYFEFQDLRLFGWVIAIAVLVLASTGGATITRDCDGQMVPDSVNFEDELLWKMDTASDTTLIDIYLGFQIVESQDTLPWHWYTLWSQKLFADYEFYRSRYEYPLHRRTWEEVGVSPDYNHLWARKTTILAVAKECYVAELWTAHALATTNKTLNMRGIAGKGGKRVDVLGRESHPRKTPANPGPSAKFYSKP